MPYLCQSRIENYVEDSDITFKRDHLCLSKFFEKKILNTKVIDWSVEISQFKITFEYIADIKNNCMIGNVFTSECTHFTITLIVLNLF